MLRIIGHQRPQIPNRLAMFAALLLAVSAFTGLRGDTQDPANPDMAKPAVEAVDDRSEREKRRSLNLRLVLFRHG